MSDTKNQYGRRVWDVEEYAERALNRSDEPKVKRVQSNATILAQTNVQHQKLAKNDWFTCDLCDRRFKDSVKLADHLAGPQHLQNVRKYGYEDEVKEVNLDMVKTHLKKLKAKLNKQGWLEGLGLNGSTEERMERQQQILDANKQTEK